MELVRGLYNIKPYHRGCLLAIGNFDGFHRGHQSLISTLKKKSSFHLPIIVMIFEPQPQEYFSRIVTIRLTRLRDKLNYLFNAGVDIVLCMKFNQQLASIKPYNFIKNILVYKLGIRCICIGNDFKFGLFRRGDFKFLKQMGQYEGFQVICAETCTDQFGYKISSTAIRMALLEDRIVDAELLMGHSYCVSGKVIHGNALGRVIGFPTANIALKGKQLPVKGVYAVEVYGIYNFPLLGIANIGMRPTISGGFQQQLEVHILNISINLYYSYISVVILAKIRDEKFFHSIAALQYQIQLDVQEVYDFFARKYLKKNRWNVFL